MTHLTSLFFLPPFPRKKNGREREEGKVAALIRVRNMSTGPILKRKERKQNFLGRKEESPFGEGKERGQYRYCTFSPYSPDHALGGEKEGAETKKVAQQNFLSVQDTLFFFFSSPRT